MTLKLRYKEPDGAESTMVEKVIKAANIRSVEPSGNFLFASSVAEFGMLLRNSEHKGEASFQKSFERAKKSLGEDPNGYRSEFLQLIQLAGQTLDH